MILRVKNKINSSIGGIVDAPSSKSYSHRAIILSSIAQGKSKLFNCLLSEDTMASINFCKSIGAEIFDCGNYLEIEGVEDKLHNNSSKAIDLANSGTTLRIATSISALCDNTVILTGDASLKTRPMGILLDTLKNLGVNTKAHDQKAPIEILPGYEGGKASISGNVSSQFISSILMSAPYSKQGVDLVVLPKFKSKPYVDMTIDIMNKFAVNVHEKSYIKHDQCNREIKDCEIFSYNISPQNYNSCSYTVEGDYSSASYLLAAAAISGGELKVNNLFKDSKQGDKFILDILRDMGCKIKQNNNNVIIYSDGELKAINVNLSDAPDLLITVAVLAALAEGTTVINGVAHARVKETDRIATTAQELKKIGAHVEELDDGMIIKGGIKGGTVNSHHDHRLAMAFSLIGLKYPIEIINGECFNISFPNFIETMGKIGFELELIKNDKKHGRKTQ